MHIKVGGTLEEKIYDLLKEVISDFIEDYMNSPYDYTLERDIHAHFYHRILSCEEEDLLNSKYPLLHLEYPHDNLIEDKGERGNLDLAILDPNNINSMRGKNGDYNKENKKLFAMEFEFNDTGNKAINHFQNDVKKLDDCSGATTFLLIFMRDKSFTHDKNRSESEYFKKLIRKEGEFCFSTDELPNEIYYINARTDGGKKTVKKTIKNIHVFTQDKKEIEYLENF